MQSVASVSIVSIAIAEEDKKALEVATAELKQLTDYMAKVGRGLFFSPGAGQYGFLLSRGSSGRLVPWQRPALYVR